MEIPVNWDSLGPFVGFRYSTDYGKTWHDTPHTPSHPLFAEPPKPGGKVKLDRRPLWTLGRDCNFRLIARLVWSAKAISIPIPHPGPRT
jgi:hypothetical protein